MNNFKGRKDRLKNNFNSFLSKVTGLESNYYDRLKQDELAELKAVLSDINNIFTLELTLVAVDWLCRQLDVDDEIKENALKRIDDTKPNSPGFDIEINEKKLKLVGEVKCVFPSSYSDKYQAAQWNSLLDDAFCLKNGKRQVLDTSEFYKFLFIIDNGKNSLNAIDNLVKPSKSISDKPLRKNRHEIKEHIVLLRTDTPIEFEKSKVYIKPLKLK